MCYNFQMSSSLFKMSQTFHINDQSVTVSRDSQEKCFVVRPLGFINEVDATLYLPFQDGLFIHDTKDCLDFLSKHYDSLKQQAIPAIAAMALVGGFWGKRMAETPKLDLVWARVVQWSEEANDLHFDLAFNDAERDTYTLWITSFRGTALTGTRREAW